jgi:hypothetical protein
MTQNQQRPGKIVECFIARRVTRWTKLQDLTQQIKAKSTTSLTRFMSQTECEEGIPKIACSLCTLLVSDVPKSQHLLKDRDRGLYDRGRPRDSVVRHKGVCEILERFGPFTVGFMSDMASEIGRITKRTYQDQCQEQLHTRQRRSREVLEDVYRSWISVCETEYRRKLAEHGRRWAQRWRARWG